MSYSAKKSLTRAEYNSLAGILYLAASYRLQIEQLVESANNIVREIDPLSGDPRLNGFASDAIWDGENDPLGLLEAIGLTVYESVEDTA